MTTSVPAPDDVLEVVKALGPSGTPVTTPEVATGFDCTQRTIYNRLESLVDSGVLQTKKVGANSRVWWRPVTCEPQRDETTGQRERVRSYPVFDSEMVGVIVWRLDSTSSDATNLVIEDANDAFLEMTGFEYEETIDMTWRTLTPEEFYADSEQHIEEVNAADSGVAYEKQYYHADGSRWWGLFESRKVDDSTYVEFVVDVTDRKEAKKRLHESEQRLRKAISIDSVGVLFFDLGGGISDANEAFERMSGYRCEELVGIDWGELTPSEFMPATDRKAEELATRGETTPYEKQLIHKDGSRWWGLFAPKRIAGTGEDAECVEFVIDITERKETEQDLRETTERLDAFVMTTTDLVYRMSPDWSEVYSLDGDPFIEVDEQRTEQWLTEYIPEDEQERVADAIEAAVETKDLFDLEHEVVLADGTRGWTRSRGMPILDDDGEIIEWFGTATDITERKRAEQERRESESRLDAFVQATSDVVYRMSPHWSEMYYLDGQEFIVDTEDPRETWLTEYIPDDEQERVMAAIETAIETKSTFELEHRVVQADGSRGWVHSRAVPMLDDAGEITEWFGTATDITERKEAEQDLRETTAKLELATTAGEVGLWTRDMETDIVSGDAFLAETYGMDPEAVAAGAPLEQFFQPVHEEDRDEVWEKIRRAEDETDEMAVEYRVQDAEGNWHWAEARAKMEYDEHGEQVRFNGTMVDITERKEKQQELRETRELLEVALDVEEMGVWELDLQTRESPYRSSRHDEIFGYDDPVDDWSLDRALDHFHPDDRETVEKRFDAALHSGDWDFESRIVRADGEQRWIRAKGTFFYEDGTPTRGVGTVQDVTERKEAERELERQAEFDAFRVDLLDAFQPLTDPVDIQETASRLLGTFLDATMAYYYEYDSEADVGIVKTDYRRDDGPRIVGRYPFDDFPNVMELLFEGLPVVLTDTHTDPRLLPAERDQYDAMEFRSCIAVPFLKDGVLAAVVVVAQSSPREWTESEISLVRETAERTWLTVEWGQAEQALKASNEGLERLNAATRELLDMEAETITDHVAGLVREILRVEYAALWRYDDRRGTLEEHTVEAAPDVDLGAISIPPELSERAWETFIGDGIEVEHTPETADGPPSPSDLGARIFVPLGPHGVIVVGSPDAQAVNEQDVDLVQMVAATVETAWDRAESEAALASQNEELTRLDQLNTLIRRINQTLVSAETRDEIDEHLCERLAESELYEFAWLGHYNPETGGVDPQAWAGVGSRYLEEYSEIAEDEPADQDPVTRAMVTGELQVVADVATDSRFTPWRNSTLTRDARSLVCIPLVYDGASYGVLSVYVDRPQSGEDERNQAVLAELGETIAYTINARETRATLQTDAVVELTLRFTDVGTPLGRLSQNVDGVLTFDGAVPRSAGETDLFFVAEEASVDDVVAAGANVLSMTDLECLTERPNGSLFRAEVHETDLASELVGAGATVRTVTYDDGTATAVVDVARSAAVRTLVEDLQQTYSAVELLARHSRERPLKTTQTFVAAVEAALTERQRTALQTAYLSGYFESPRVTTGEGVSVMLDISQPTFSQHLRAAERALCEILFQPAQAG